MYVFETRGIIPPHVASRPSMHLAYSALTLRSRAGTTPRQQATTYPHLFRVPGKKLR